MKTIPKRTELLRELVSCRKFLLSQLADLAEEEGNVWVARAWRWVRDHEKWPTPRWNQKTRKKDVWGWNLAGRWECKRRGCSTLSVELYMEGLLRHEFYSCEEDALLAAAYAVSRYLEKRI